MITRRQAREWALQLLVQFDLNPPASLDRGIEEFWEMQAQLEVESLAEGPHDAQAVFTATEPALQASLVEMRAFTEDRVRGVWAERSVLDEKIGGFLRNWSMYRLGSVERNALRIGAWELLHCPEIPAPILVNEAIDLAKFFSETKSGRFVNGILDSYAKDLKKAEQEGEFTP